jgi:hypothetical protein
MTGISLENYGNIVEFIFDVRGKFGKEEGSWLWQEFNKMPKTESKLNELIGLIERRINSRIILTYLQKAEPFEKSKILLKQYLLERTGKTIAQLN